jgi:vacuole morphology and inheritance protein 14
MLEVGYSKAKGDISVELEFPPHILKHLNDRNQDKRDQAGKELQAIITRNLDKKNLLQIEKILTYFQDNYLKSSTVANKKIGIEVFVFIVNGFKNHNEEAARLIYRIVLPIVECFNDTEQRIRYNAIKNLYFICKALENVCMLVFNDIFEQLIGKIADFDEQVKNAAALLNNVLKTIITDSLPNNKTFDLTRFMRILTDKMKAINPFIREFLIDWINTMDEIPSVNILVYLPSFLEDLLVMLSDKEKEVRSKAE